MIASSACSLVTASRPSPEHCQAAGQDHRKIDLTLGFAGVTRGADPALYTSHVHLRGRSGHGIFRLPPLPFPTLLKARTSLLLASGTAKAPAIHAAVEGPISTQCPASALRTCQSVTAIVDRAAASDLKSKGKPDEPRPIQAGCA